MGGVGSSIGGADGSGDDSLLKLSVSDEEEYVRRVKIGGMSSIDLNLGTVGLWGVDISGTGMMVGNSNDGVISKVGI